MRISLAIFMYHWKLGRGEWGVESHTNNVGWAQYNRESYPVINTNMTASCSKIPEKKHNQSFIQRGPGGAGGSGMCTERNDL